MILYGKNKELTDWVSYNVLGITKAYDDNSKAIGNIVDGELVAAVTYNHFRARPTGEFLTVEMGIYTTHPKWATRDFLRAIFEYPFIQIGMPRVETSCEAKNTKVVEFNKKMGFVFEGIRREYWPMGGDAMLFSMLKDECKWLTKPKN
jgi:RimJ/RimL family protein N-acetyltransferase